MGSTSTWRRRRGPGDAVEQPDAGPLAEQAHRLVHGAERRLAEATGVDVIEADQGHVPRHPDACCRQRLQDADRHLVVGAHDGVREGRPVLCEHALPGFLAALHAEMPLVGADEGAGGIGAASTCSRPSRRWPNAAGPSTWNSRRR